MKPESINIPNDIQLLHYERVLNYFKDMTNALNVTLNKNGNLEINFDIINKLIDQMTTQPNIYGLLTMTNGTGWKLRYIGQRKAKDIKQRLYQHLINKHQNTGSQLDKIKKELMNGNPIGIKLTGIFPDELRHYYEEKLLQDIKPLDWNIQK